MTLKLSKSVPYESSGIYGTSSARIIRESTIVTRKFETVVVLLDQNLSVLQSITLRSGAVQSNVIRNLDFSGCAAEIGQATVLSVDGVVVHLSEDDPSRDLPMFCVTAVDFFLRTFGLWHQEYLPSGSESHLLATSALPIRCLVSVNSLRDSESDGGCYVIGSTGPYYASTSGVHISLHKVSPGLLDEKVRYGDYGLDAEFARSSSKVAINHGDMIGIWGWSTVGASLADTEDAAETPLADLMEVIELRTSAETHLDDSDLSRAVLCFSPSGRKLVYARADSVRVKTLGPSRGDDEVVLSGSAEAAAVDDSENLLAFAKEGTIEVVDLGDQERRFSAQAEGAGNCTRLEFIQTSEFRFLLFCDEDRFWLFEIHGVVNGQADLQLSLFHTAEAICVSFSHFGQSFLIVDRTHISIYQPARIDGTRCEEASPLHNNAARASFIAEWKFLLEFGDDRELDSYFESIFAQQTEDRALASDLLKFSSQACRARGVALALKIGADPIAVTSTSGPSPLSVAVQSSDVDSVMAMLEWYTGALTQPVAELRSLHESARNLVSKLEEQLDKDLGNGPDTDSPLGDMFGRVQWDAIRSWIDDAKKIHDAIEVAIQA